jgi:xylulose-5-phosphate/fructose-6-phosphate phosphoketolase
LAIRNQTDRFNLAIDAIDRMPRFRVTASSAREALIDRMIECVSYAHEVGIDRLEDSNWRWPF